MHHFRVVGPVPVLLAKNCWLCLKSCQKVSHQNGLAMYSTGLETSVFHFLFVWGLFGFGFVCLGGSN